MEMVSRKERKVEEGDERSSKKSLLGQKDRDREEDCQESSIDSSKK